MLFLVPYPFVLLRADSSSFTLYYVPGKKKVLKNCIFVCQTRATLERVEYKTIVPPEAKLFIFDPFRIGCSL